MTTCAAVLDRRTNLSYEDFVAEYLRPGRPVVIQDAMKDWKALQEWNLEFFRSRYGTKQLKIGSLELTMKELIDRIEQSPDSAPYLANWDIPQLDPKLLEDMDPFPPYLSPNWLTAPPIPARVRHMAPQLYIGAAGARFPFLHYDSYSIHVFLGQLQGVKEYTVYGPDQSEYLYPKLGTPNSNQSWIGSIDEVDLKEFPLFAKAVPTVLHLHPGDFVFLPARWWHTVRLLSNSITVSFNNSNESNWNLVTESIADRLRYESPLVRLPAKAALGLTGGLYRWIRSLPR